MKIRPANVQHWTGPLLQESWIPLSVGAATMKIAMVAAVKRASLENIFKGLWVGDRGLRS